LTVSDPHTYM